MQLQSFGNLNNVFNWALPFAQGLGTSGQNVTNAGVGDLSQAGNYYKKLLSGNRSDLFQAEAPAVNSAIGAGDASKRNLGASGTARGGGVSASNQQIDDKTRATIDNLLFGVRPGAAKELGDIGAKEAQIGTLEAASAIQGGQLAEYATSDAGKLATQAKDQTDAQQQAEGSAAASIFMDALALA